MFRFTLVSITRSCWLNFYYKMSNSNSYACPLVQQFHLCVTTIPTWRWRNI